MINKEKAKIEIEYRARFSKQEYLRLKRFLTKKSKNLGKDDKNVYFFSLPDKLLKVTDNISAKTAKITVKLNKIGMGSSFQELEIPINRKDILKAIDILSALGFKDVHSSFQKRENFLYKGVEIALKYSEMWGFHCEMEIVVNDVKKKKSADEKIQRLAKELNIKLMSETELRKFIKSKEAEIQKNRVAFS